MDHAIESIAQPTDDDTQRTTFETQETQKPTQTYTHWLGPNKYVEISVDPKSIRSSFVQLAVESGQDEREARDFIDQIPITLILEKPEPPSIISKMTKRRTNTPLGSVSFNRTTDSVTGLMLNIPNIIKGSSDKHNKTSAHFKREGGKDETYIREILNFIWKHEATHLTDMMNPKYRTEIFTATRKNEQYVIMGIIPSALGVSSLVGAEIAQTHNNELIIVLGGIILIGGIITITSQAYYDKYSKHEKRADEHGKEISPNYKSPFNINFYNYNGPEL